MVSDQRLRLGTPGRSSRRIFLSGAATAGLAAAAAGLVGCSSKNTASSANSTKAAVAPTAAAGQSAGAARAASAGSAGASPTPAALDSTKGKPSGTFKFMLAGFPANFTVTANATAYNETGYFHSSLLAQAWGQESVAPDAFSAVEPDLAQAIPEQPDPLTYTFKLRPGVKFHNGRTMTADDVKYSYDRWANYEKSVYRTTWQTWYDHMEITDPQTIVVKAKVPYVDGVLAMAGNTTGYIMAREFEESPDSANKMMGTGPFIWSDTQPPVSITLKKNPDYYLKPFPYFDQIQLLSTTDPVARITNFTTKQVHMPWLVYAQDRDQIKQQRPDAKIEEFLSWGQSVFMRTDKAPWKDARVRQALSMAIDRKAIRDTVNKGEGRDEQFFNIMYKDYLGTSEVKDLGDPAKYWQYNPQAAKQLFAAAGVTQPIEATQSHYIAAIVGQWLVDIATLTQAQWKQLGLANITDFPDPQWGNKANIGDYDNISMSITTGINSGAPAFALTIRDQVYWGPNGEHSPANAGYINDPDLSALSVKQLGQTNKSERAQTLRQMEQIMAQQQYRICYSTTTQSWLWDPSLRNVSLSVEQASKRYMMKWWFA